MMDGLEVGASKHLLLAPDFSQDVPLQICIAAQELSFQRVFGGWFLACNIPTVSLLQLQFALSCAGSH